MLNRHEYREKIVFALYQHLLLHKSIRECFNNNFEDEEFDEYSEKICLDLEINESNYIEEISKHLVKWSFDRLNLVEQAILLESASEINIKEVDKPIIIDEAVILTKTYCDEESYKYINGVLDNLCNN